MNIFGNIGDKQDSDVLVAVGFQLGKIRWLKYPSGKMSDVTRHNTLKSVMKDYAKATQFHGFAIMSDASVPLMVTWGLLIAFAFGFAARDFVSLVEFYQSEPTMLSVSVKSNANFIIPTPTICMETTIPYLSKDRQYLSSVRYYTTDGIIVNDIDQLLLSTDNVTRNYDKMVMSYRLFYYTYALLAYWTDAEMRLVGQQQDYHRKLFTDWSIQDPNLSDSIQVVYNIYKSRNVSLANLKRLVARQLCAGLISMSLKFIKSSESYSTTPTYDACSPDFITHLSFSLVCLKVFDGPSVQLNASNAMSIRYGPIVPFDNYGIKEYYDWMNSLTKNGSNYVGFSSTESRGIFPPPTTTSMDDPDNTWVIYRWHLDLKGRATLPQTSGDSVISWNPMDNTFISVSVASEFQFFNSKSQPCATETQYDCEWRQRISQIHQKCGCWPSSLIFAANSSLHPRCEVNLSAAYRGKAVVGRCQANANLTIQPCLSECQLISYDKGQLESSYWDVPFLRFPRYRSLPHGHFELTLETSDKRLVITESTYKDWTTFAAEVGGSIGTWLGASLLTFVHLPYFFIPKLLQRLYNHRKMTETVK